MAGLELACDVGKQKRPDPMLSVLTPTLTPWGRIDEMRDASCAGLVLEGNTTLCGGDAGNIVALRMGVVGTVEEGIRRPSLSSSGDFEGVFSPRGG